MPAHLDRALEPYHGHAKGGNSIPFQCLAQVPWQGCQCCQGGLCVAHPARLRPVEVPQSEGALVCADGHGGACPAPEGLKDSVDPCAACT